MKVCLHRSRDAKARTTGFIMSSTISYPAGYHGRKSSGCFDGRNLTSVSGDISVVGYLDCKNAECEGYEALSLMFVDHPRLVELCAVDDARDKRRMYRVARSLP